MRASKLAECFLLSILVLAAFCTMQTTSAQPGTSSGEPVVIPSYKIAHPTVLSSQNGTAHVLITFDVDTSSFVNDIHKPLNLGLVMDRSGSMSDANKMQFTREAACYMIEKLDPTTRLALVAYDERIDVLSKSVMVENKSALKAKVNELTPRGSTNLTGGMMRGVSEIEPYAGSEMLSRVILMSDGLANQGVTDLPSILRLVKEAAHKGVSITTMGVGLDYNDILMEEIAKTSGGNYYFIEHPDQIKIIYEQEISSLYQMLTSDLTCSFTPSRQTSGFEVFGYNVVDETKIVCSDFYVGEQRSMMLKIDYQRSSEPIHLGIFSLRYFDNKAKKIREFSFEFVLDVTNSQDVVDKNANEDVIIEKMLRETEVSMNRSTEYVRVMDFTNAYSTMESQIHYLRSENEHYRNNLLEYKVKALEVELENMKEAEQDQESQAAYVKASRSRQASQSQGGNLTIIMVFGDSGTQVRLLQKALKDLGYYNGDIDGYFSKEVEDALKKFQKDNNLPADGQADPQTQSMLKLY